MTTFTESHARLANDVYKDGALLSGTPFTIAATVDKPSGYHGVIYRNEFSRELVVAHRGTEFDGDKLRDLAVTDAQMALLKVNQQLEGAREAIELALALAKQSSATVTVTGHSLGGTLAQITAHEYGLHGETFNAYGAAGLYDTPMGGNQVLNHVRATDMVAAANAHFGRVQVYALQADLDALVVNERPPRRQNRAELIADIAQLHPGKTHGVVQFHGGARNAEDLAAYGANSIVSSASQARYERHRSEFDAYRGGIQSTARDLSMGVMLSPAGLLYATGIGQQHVLHKVGDALFHNEEIHRLHLEEQRAIEVRNRNFHAPKDPLIFRDRATHGSSADLREQLERAAPYLVPAAGQAPPSPLTDVPSVRSGPSHDEGNLRESPDFAGHRIGMPAAIAPQARDATTSRGPFVDPNLNLAYHAALVDDDALLMKAARQVHDSPDGQRMLQMGQELYAEQQRHEALQQSQVHVRQGPVLGR